MKQEIIYKLDIIRKGSKPNGYKKSIQLNCVIPIEWKESTIITHAALFNGDRGKNYPNANDMVSDGIPFINAGDLNAGRVDLVNVNRITKEKYDTLGGAKIRKNDIVYCLRGSLGKNAFIDNLDEGTVASSLVVIRAITINPRYLFYIINSDFEYRQRILNDEGAAQPNLSAKNVGNFIIPLPSQNEQQDIVEILSTWDKAIELKEKLIEGKKKQKSGLMQKLLTGKVRLPGFDGEWDDSQLKDHFGRVTRKNPDSCQNVLTISAQKGLVNQEDYFNKSVASSNLDNYFLLKNGEFAYNKSYSNGYPMGAIKRLNDYDEGVVTTLYICFYIKNSEKSNGDYFEHYFDSGLLNTALTQIAHEGGRAHGLLNVSPKDFFDLKVIVPPCDEQKAIASVLNTTKKEIDLHEKELEALKQQKKGLMQFLLTGIVRVNGGTN